MLDASAAAELVLETAAGAEVAERLRGHAVHAPGHFDVEVVGVIRRAVQRGLLRDHEGLVALDAFRSLRIRCWPTQSFMKRAYALRATHTVADAVYLALTEALDATLVTCDGRLARSHGHRATIDHIDPAATGT